MRKRFNSNKFKKILAVVGIVLAAVMLCAVIGNVTGGFENLFKPDEWTFRSVNEDNVYQSFAFADKDGVINDGVNGITVKLDEYNAVKVKGTSEGDQAIIIASGTLKANTTYVFDSSLDDGSGKTIYMSIVDESGEVLAASYTGAVVVDALSADTTVYVKLNVAADYEAKYTITLKPILCVGESADDLIKFFA